jgi:hypothetical protein
LSYTTTRGLSQLLRFLETKVSNHSIKCILRTEAHAHFKIQDVAFDISWESDLKRYQQLSSQIIALPTCQQDAIRSLDLKRKCWTDLQSYTSGDTGPGGQQANTWSSTHSRIPRSPTLSTRPTHIHIVQRAMLPSPLNLPSMICQSPNVSPPPQKPFRNFLHRTSDPQERPPLSTVSQVLPQRLPANTHPVCASEARKVDVYHLVK